MLSRIESRNDLISMPSVDPRDLRGSAVIGGTRVQLFFSNALTVSNGTWITSPFSLGPSAPVCAALGVDRYQCVEWANNDLQLSHRDNAETREDAQGTIPVISFTGGNLTGNIILEITLKRTGHFLMGLRGIDGSSNRSMYEMEWMVVR